MEEQATWGTETRQYEKVMVSQYIYLRENNEYIIQERGEALFRGFDHNDMEEDVTDTSILIVEWPDGSLERIPVSPLIRFIEPHTGG
jgi:hypothetical protein